LAGKQGPIFMRCTVHENRLFWTMCEDAHRIFRPWSLLSHPVFDESWMETR